MRLCDARLSAKLSLRELARRADDSASLVSQIELGRTSPSIGTLYALVSALGLSLDVVMHGVTPLSIPSPSTARLMEAKNRPKIRVDRVLWERLTLESDPHVELLRVTYRIGTESCPPDNLSGMEVHEYTSTSLKEDCTLKP